MRAPFIRFAIPSAALLLLGAGCSSISVQPRTAHIGPAAAPRRIVVTDYTYAGEGGNIRVDRSGAPLREFKKNLTAKMRAYLSKDLTRFGLPVADTRHSVADVPAWIVKGEFTRINQGSRALRVVVGAGAGGTKMETRVQVLDSRTGRVVCAFRTTGGSNADSGIITSYGPLTVATAGGVLINIAGSSAHGVTEDARRTAKMTADYISQQLARRGAIPESKAREAKILSGPVDPLGSLRN
jgi:hypothetical protein